MKKFLLILLLASAPLHAADPVKDFVKAVNKMGETGDPQQWRSLYCGPHVMSYGETQSLKSFTKATIGEADRVPRPGVKAKLSMCSARQGATEKCLPIPVGEKDGRLCLM